MTPRLLRHPRVTFLIISGSKFNSTLNEFATPDIPPEDSEAETMVD